MQNPKKFRESMEEARGRGSEEKDQSGDEDGWGDVKSPFFKSTTFWIYYKRINLEV